MNGLKAAYNSMQNSQRKSESASLGNVTVSQVFYLPQKPKIELVNLPETFAKEKNEKVQLKVQRKKSKKVLVQEESKNQKVTQRLLS